jgi:hypothetical protein
MLEGPPNRRGEALTRDFHLRLRFPVPFKRTDFHAGLTYVVLIIMLGTGVEQFPRYIMVGNIQDTASEFWRRLLPRTRVNKGIKKGRHPGTLHRHGPS